MDCRNLHWTSHRVRYRTQTGIAACLVGIVASATCGTPPSRIEPIADRIEKVHFSSRTFNTEKHYCVVMPADFDRREKDLPVLFLLHGRGRNDRSLIDEKETRVALLNAPFVTVLPNGEDGWYIDSPVQPHHAYARLLDETIRDAECRFKISHRPEERAIAGWSMGGYGCVSYAASRPRSFTAVVSMIGLLDFPGADLPPDQSYQVPTKTFGTNQATWKRLNPAHNVEQLRGLNILLITADRAFDRTMNENFRARLSELKIPHQWKVLPGGHHFDVVKQAIPEVVHFVAEQFERPRVGKSGF